MDILAIFGGTTLIVPKDWKVTLDLVSVLGGFSDKRRRDPNIEYEEDKHLIIKGFILFGGGELKS